MTNEAKRSEESGSTVGLERCPFCGSDELDGPHLTEYIGDHRHPHWWIECLQCPAGMQACGETSAPVVDAWNKRSNAGIVGQGALAPQSRTNDLLTAGGDYD